MPRLARSVFSNIPHPISPRGNPREDVFFTDDDRLLYLEWLQFYCEKYNVSTLAYCLMSNHIHLVLTPHSESGLQQALKPLHMRYAGLVLTSATFIKKIFMKLFKTLFYINFNQF